MRPVYDTVASQIARRIVRIATRRVAVQFTFPDGTAWGPDQPGTTSITLSQEQAELANERIKKRGLDNLAEVRIVDYRDVDGQYDAIVGIEMIEAVGGEFWPDYFATIDKHLAPGGDPGHHDEPRADARDAQLVRVDTEVHLPKWPDPLPAGDRRRLPTAHDAAGQPAPRAVAPLRRAPGRWRTRFIANWGSLEGQGFDLIFRRTWEFYWRTARRGSPRATFGVSQLRLVRISDIR